MKIGIIGSGNIGATLAIKWKQKGHEVTIGVQKIDDFKNKDLLQKSGVKIALISQLPATSEILLNATPAHVAIEVIHTLDNDLTGKVLIDASNAVQVKPTPYPTALHAFVDMTNAEVVKCFNSTGFGNLENPIIANQALDMFMAGNSEKGKMIAEQLALDLGFENCYDFGGIDKVTLLEQFALSWINLAMFQGLGRDFGFKIVKK